MRELKNQQISEIQSQLLRYVKLFILQFLEIIYKDSDIVGLRDQLLSIQKQKKRTTIAITDLSNTSPMFIRLL